VAYVDSYMFGGFYFEKHYVVYVGLDIVHSFSLYVGENQMCGVAK
jgi:hypothetical protein